MTQRGLHGWIGAGLLASTMACSELPEVAYEREGFALAVEFEQPVCEGTLRGMEQRVAMVERTTGIEQSSPMTIYWLAGELERICPRPASGCFIPGTMIIAATGPSLHHEIVHAVMNTRGSVPYAEEGLAEVLSGQAVYYNPDFNDRPLRDLGQTRKDAREGAIDYVRAAHFMHFVREQVGEDGVRDLAAAIDAGNAPRRFVDILERHFEMEAEDIERAYARSGSFYPSVRFEEAEPITAFDLSSGVNLSLDCASKFTMGPPSAASAGMFRLRRIEGDERVRGTLAFEGEGDVGAVLFRAVDPGGRWVQDWWRPVPRLDDKRIELRPGDRVSVDLDLREGWMVLARTDDPSELLFAGLQVFRTDGG